MEALNKECIERALEIMDNPIRTYSAGCLKCGKTFVSYQRMDNFIDCEEHKCNDNYLMIKPIK